jgi:hypothetical protein
MGEQAKRLLSEALIVLGRPNEDGRVDLAACLNRLAILDQTLIKLAESKPR